MSLATLLTDPVTLQTRATATDSRGDTYSTWTAGATVSGRLTPASTVGAGSSERLAGQDQIVVDWLLLLPAGTPLGPYDRVVDAAGRRWDVVGAPVHASSPRGPHHVEAHVRWVEG